MYQAECIKENIGCNCEIGRERFRLIESRLPSSRLYDRLARPLRHRERRTRFRPLATRQRRLLLPPPRRRTAATGPSTAVEVSPPRRAFSMMGCR